MGHAGEQRPRAPGYVYGVLAVVVTVLVAAIALFAQQPPPPTIAEFAPQAAEQITDAPAEQASAFGDGPGVDCVGDACADGGGDVGAPTPPPVDVNRVRACVGNPPRQIEDPQSPPCVPYWEGDNGGSTYKGVTRNEVRVVVPVNTKFMRLFESFFNARFEFYGRKLRLIDNDVGFGGDEVEEMIANAVKADEELDVFASTMYGSAGGEEFVYYDELARRGIVSVNARPTAYGEEHLRRRHPYQWSYLPGHTEMSVAKARFACTALAGGRARYAGGAEALERRVFGLVRRVDESGHTADVGPMTDVLRRCGVDVPVQKTFHPDAEGEEQKNAEAIQIIADLQQAGVTTIFCQCGVNDMGYYLSNAANAQGYEPEWVVDNFLYFTDDAFPQFYNYQPTQLSHTFGLNWWSKQLPPQDSPWLWALREVDPGYPIGNVNDYYDARWLYNSLLILASGIQMAGPNLTPETFAEGLQSTRWPNPKAGRAPYYQGTVSFRGDHTAIDDAAIIWVGTTEESNWYNRPGAICWADSGLRYAPTAFPADVGDLFRPPCY